MNPPSRVTNFLLILFSALSIFLILNIPALATISSLVWTQKSDWGTGMFNNTTVHSNTTNYVSLIQEFVNDTNTVALWHFNGGSGANYSDSSTLENLTTLQGGGGWTGNAKFGDAAANFTNDTVYANMTMSASMLNVFEGGTYTVEGWVYINETSHSTSRMIYGIVGGGGLGGERFALVVMPDGKLDASVQGGNTFITGKAQAPLREWFHVAVVSGSTSRLFLNGGQEGTSASLATGTGGRTFLLNRRFGGGFPGMQDEVRISNTARYASNFTLNQYPLKGEYTSNATTSAKITSVTATWNMTPLNWTQTSNAEFALGRFYNQTTNNRTNLTHNPFLETGNNSVMLMGEFVSDANTEALLHINEGSGTAIADSSPSNIGLTLSGSYAWSAADSKFGNSVLTFTGGYGLGNSAPGTVTGTNSRLTVETWIYPTTFAFTSPDGGYILNRVYEGASGSDVAGDWQISVTKTTGKVVFYIRGASAWTGLTTTTALSLDRWYHIAGVWDGTTVRVYINGTADATTAGLTGAIDDSGNTHRVIMGTSYPGVDPRPFNNGRIDEARVSNTARYTADFTPNPYPQSGNFTSQSLDFSGNATVYRAYANVSEVYSSESSAAKTNITLTLGYSQDKITWFSANTSDAISINGTYAFSVPQTTARYWNWTAALKTNASNTTPVLDDVELEYGPTVEVSADGSSYITVVNSTAATGGAGIGSGTSLKWRANFTTNNTSFSPTLNEISITYDYRVTLPEELNDIIVRGYVLNSRTGSPLANANVTGLVVETNSPGNTTTNSIGAFELPINATMTANRKYTLLIKVTDQQGKTSHIVRRFTR